MGRIIRTLFATLPLIVAGLAIGASMPEIKRYLRMKKM